MSALGLSRKHRNERKTKGKSVAENSKPKMSLLFSNPLTSLSYHAFSSSSSSPLYSSLTLPAVSVFRQLAKPIGLHANGIEMFRPTMWSKTDISVVRASADVDGTPSGEEEKNSGVEKMPLESKLQERMEQKQKMKLARKIRLRRKRLVRKRRLRKKGRWPPSKMKKLKNV